MPPRRRLRSKLKCAYQEGKRRCPYDAVEPFSNPPLCRAHQLVVAEAAKPKAPGERLAEMLVDLLNGQAIDRDAAINAAKQVFSDWRTAQARAAQPGWTGWSPGRQAPPPPRTPPVDDQTIRARQVARQVMGFSPTEPLDADKIRKRKRTLAERHHPDRGGSTEKMAMINDAADILMQML